MCCLVTLIYSWYREREGRLQPALADSWAWAGGAAQCVRRASPAAAGLWICKAYNVYGDATAHSTLHVLDDSLSKSCKQSSIQSRECDHNTLTGGGRGQHGALQLQRVGPARVSVLATQRRSSQRGRGRGRKRGACAAGGGARAPRRLPMCGAPRLTVRAGRGRAASRRQLVFDGWTESAPELQYTFIEQALRAGGAVSLRCAAAGSPPPRFQWLLDDVPLDHYRASHRYFINEETSVTGDVVSTLNVSAVSAADGGRYTCRAYNALGHARHSARLNIYGPPSIRALGPVRVVAGANATIYCPYAGYPIRSIEVHFDGMIPLYLLI
ncbi:hypothetical protein HF086_015253 [Spodoptera exigua]|uniref:Ig-like domain-containing protein n=1 Tax=Spodoptera exigua TaxID=7107 RepID=A0A922SFN8_SPOEX|nr:hypothetical protein HF086_015253 [Spodoptera exigua]